MPSTGDDLNKVAYQAIRVIASAISRLKKRPLDEVLVLFPSTLPANERASDYLDWNDFAAWMETLNAEFHPIVWRDVGELIVQQKTYPGLVTLTRLTFTVRSAYWLAAKWFGPSQFTAIRCLFEDIGSSQIRETLTLSESARPCRLVFEMFEGCLAAAPAAAFDLPPSQVKASLSSRHAIYEITFPVHYRPWTKLKIFLSGFFHFRSLLRELASQQTALQHQAQTLELERSEFKNLIELFPHGILIHKSGIIRYVNPQLAAYFDLSDLNGSLGKSLLDYIHPTDRQAVKERLQLGPDRYFKPQEISLLSPNSARTLHCDYTSIPISFEGEPATAVVIRDLTEQKNLQAHLMLSDRMRALGQLAAGVGHEINNPMFFVMMKTEKLTGYLQEQKDPVASQMVKDIQGGLNRIHEIVKQLKSFSRGHDEAPIPVDVAKVMQSSLEMAQNIISLRARLKVSIAPVAPVLANEAHLGQVFLNLLINAAQAIETGSIEENEIEVKIDNTNRGFISIEVRDSGVGIPEQIRQHLFQPFYTTKAVGEGTGLGLSICHSIVSRYKGSIDFKSVSGKGTTFQVLLPVAAEINETTEIREPVTFIAQTHGRVLVLDDDEGLIEILESVVSNHFETVALTDPREALRLVDNGADFDCIVCDLMMPYLDGQQFYQQLKAKRPELCEKIFFLTGGSYSKKHDDFLNLPEIHYLEKPIESIRLINMIQNMILTREPPQSSNLDIL